MGALALVVACACAVPGRGRFPDRAPLRVEPEKPFSPAPPAVDRGDRAGGADDQVFFEWDQKMAFAPRLPAQNVNSLDEVPDSSFFTNRVAGVTAEDVRRGGEYGDPLADEGPIEVVGAKTAGVTGGMVVKDARGQKFVLKFDPIGRYGLLSGCEAATSRLLWAAGYNVPDNRVVYFEPGRLVPSKDDGAPAPETIAYVLSRAARTPDGRIRALASKFVDGKVLGAMPWRGTRAGDPNDRVRHELRRELRGLKYLYVWVADPDAKIGNSLDAWQEDPRARGKGLVKHYLIDLGTSLGASGNGSAAAGWWFSFAWRAGNYHEGVEDAFRSAAEKDASRAVRREREGDDYLWTGIDPEVDPEKYRWLWYNAAFERADARDAAWAARLLTHLDEAKIRAAIEAADWPADVTDRVVERLLARKRSLLGHVFRKASALDAPHIKGTRVCARDLSRLFSDKLVQGGSDTLVCAAPPAADGYHVLSLQGGGRAMKVHVLRGGDELRIVGVER